MRTNEKRTPTTKISCDGRKLRGAASPWTLNLSKVPSTQAGSEGTPPLHGKEELAEGGKGPQRIKEYRSMKRLTVASLDLNEGTNRGVQGC